jgi:hypothetical protein
MEVSDRIEKQDRRSPLLVRLEHEREEVRLCIACSRYCFAGERERHRERVEMNHASSVRVAGGMRAVQYRTSRGSASL